MFPERECPEEGHDTLFLLVLLLVFLGLGLGCGETAATAPIPEQEIAIGEEVDTEVEAPPSIYAEDGSLLSSETEINGLVLPLGLTPEREEERRHIFSSRSSVAQLKAYFGPRLDTGNVQDVGLGSMYRGARSRQAHGEALRMDILLLPVGADTVRVDIRDLPTPTNGTRSERELRENARRAATYWAE